MGNGITIDLGECGFSFPLLNIKIDLPAPRQPKQVALITAAPGMIATAVRVTPHVASII